MSQPDQISKSTLVDFILCSRRDKITSAVFGLGLSDHCPLVCAGSERLKIFRCKIVIKRNLKHFIGQAFQSDLADSIL